MLLSVPDNISQGIARLCLMNNAKIYKGGTSKQSMETTHFLDQYMYTLYLLD